MKYADFMQKYGVIIKRDLRKGDTVEHLENVIGKQVWICDYRLNDKRDYRPLRNVAPQLVEVFGLDSLPKGENVYYSEIYFKPVVKGKVGTKIISPIDNTGFRSRSGTSVNIFEKEADCIACYKQQVAVAIAEFEAKVTEINNHIETLRKL